MRRAATRLLILAAAAVAGNLASSPAARAQEPAPEWPFGVPRSGGAAAQPRDLYNLGPLGVKVAGAAAGSPVPAPGEEPATGRRSFTSRPGDEGPADDGPPRLVVEILYPGGPAETAGLRLGDVITGVGGKSFSGGSLDPIAKAITKAESGAAKGVVAFTVERAGDPAPVKVDVTIPVLGKEWAAPTTGKPREEMIGAACRWLADRQEKSGGFRQTMSGLNGAVVQTSVAGLCWLAAGSDLQSGPYSEQVRLAYEFVAGAVGEMGSRHTGPGPNQDQSNWGWTYAAIFLGELQARSPDDADLKALLVQAGEEIVARQEKSGGWAHGPGGPNALDYVELNIVTALAVTGLGMAARAGYVIPPEALARARTYLEESGGGDGGVGYSTRRGQRGAGNIGRTACAWLGFAVLGLRKDPFALKMERYVRSNAGAVFGGHASLMQHYMFSGIAAQAIGIDAARAYWAVCERDLVLARSPDGAFQPRPWHESILMSSNTDASTGDVWTTASWTLVLAAEPSKDGTRPGLPVLTGRAAPAKPKK